MAAYAWHAAVLGKRDEEVTAWFYKGMRAIGEEHSVDESLALLMEFGEINLKCMALLDEANTSAYGRPVPTKVTTIIEKGPFIVVSGHDFHDLKQLLEQTEGKGINIYTMGKCYQPMLTRTEEAPAFKGEFRHGLAKPEKELDGIPGAVLLPPTA